MTALCFYAAQQSTEAMGVNHSFNHSVYMSDDTVPLKTKGNSKNKGIIISVISILMGVSPTQKTV